MPKRNSKWNSRNIPTLARFYMDAHEDIYDVRPFVHSNHYGRFLVFEDELREFGYSCKEYAYTVVKILEKWKDSKGFKHIPVVAFTGDWALKKFMRVADSKHVDISNDDYSLYHSELIVARSYIYENAYNGRCVKLRDVVNELRPLLSEQWLEKYDSGGERPIDDVLDDLCDEYGVVVARNYNSIVDAIRDISI